MSVTAPYRPTPERVGVAVVKAVVDITPVATALGDATALRSGFVTVRAIDTSPANIDLPRRSSYLKVDVWASPATPASTKPQWNVAAGIAEQIRDGLDNAVQRFGRLVNVGAGYSEARVYAAYLMTEPRRVENDPNAYARMTFDLMVDWALA